MVHAARHGTTANRDARRIRLIGRYQITHRLDVGTRRNNQGCVIADGPGYQGQIAEVVWEYTGQRADHDRCGIDHQRAMIAGGILDEIADGLTAAAARHVFVRGLTNEACLCQRLTRAAGRAVPAATSAAGDQKVDRVDDLMAIGDSRASDPCCQRCGDECTPRNCPCFHFFLPKKFTDVTLQACEQLCCSARKNPPETSNAHLRN